MGKQAIDKMGSKKGCGRHSADGRFPIVGIGASAGGLKSIKKMFSTNLENMGMAYIVVVHMLAKHPSLMAEILQKRVTISVSEAADGETIRADHIYITPPDKCIQIVKGCIWLKDLPPKHPFHPIDAFLKTLALDQKENAVAVILSGTGSDGSTGVKAVKAFGGLVMVESEDLAEYDGMPKSAINTGLCDVILPSEKMIPRIGQFYCLNRLEWNGIDERPIEDHSKWLNKVFSILQARIGHNFSYYKTNTILRRISRRMGISKTNNPKDYLRVLKKSPDEVESLFNELLIGVTSFFRDPESYEILGCKALAESFEKMDDEGTFRIWVPGCSTGEEVYSLAMLCIECIDRMGKRINLQMFGTDIDKSAISIAREGLYPGSITSEVSPERLQRFFQKHSNGYKIRKKIRGCAVFSIQDVIKDPPFSKLDLVCCRNLLIYLNAKAQKRILPLFHYTLNPGGILMLGASETIGSFGNLFATVDNKWKIFKRREVSRSLIQQIDFPIGLSYRQYRPAEYVPDPRKPVVNIARLAQDLILEQCAPTAVLVEKNGTILYVQGRTGKYLETRSGTPSLNILDLAREGLKIELSSAIREASLSDKLMVRPNIAVKNNGGHQFVTLKVSQVQRPSELSGRLLVVFEAIPPDVQEESSKEVSNTERKRIYDLEKELQSTRESHQVTIEELESSNEELKSTNEELQSSNEELQSTNEELESSKEELQSLNEELQTVNSELQSKVEELSSAHDDMRNLLNSTQIATIFVDMDIHVKRFTSEASTIVNLIQTDIGRPLKHVATNLKYDHMIPDIEHVLMHLSTTEKDIQADDGRWYNMRVMPYRTTDNRIDGAVITFVNMTGQKQATLEMKKAWHLTRNVFDLNENPLVIIDDYGKVKIANAAFSVLIGISAETVEGISLFKLKSNILNFRALKKIVEKTKEKERPDEITASGLIAGQPNYDIRIQYFQEEESREFLILLEVVTM